MARNVQLWSRDFGPLLDGPSATPDDIRRAAEVVATGGEFGYRFLFPALRVGRHELYWHRPVVAYLDRHTNRPGLIDSAPGGYLTAYRAGEMDFDKPLELWPRLLRRNAHVANVDAFQHLEEPPPLRTTINVYKLLHPCERGGREPLPSALARQPPP